ncbi:MAG: conjugative transfer signal peptidase TraF [Bacteroidota bacterium]
MTARHVGLMGWLLGGSIIVAGMVAEAAGLRINTTPSLPRGLWLVVGDPGLVRIGDVVTFCPPLVPVIELAQERGYVGPGNCPGGLELMMKPVVALAGDTVAVSSVGVTVNGQVLVDSVPLSRDGAGRLLPQAETGPGTVAEGQVWVLSSHNVRSFDSRYFGPIPHAHLTAILRPLWTETSP